MFLCCTTHWPSYYSSSSSCSAMSPQRRCCHTHPGSHTTPPCQALPPAWLTQCRAPPRHAGDATTHLCSDQITSHPGRYAPCLPHPALTSPCPDMTLSSTLACLAFSVLPSVSLSYSDPQHQSSVDGPLALADAISLSPLNEMSISGFS